jgi:glutamate/tyrosine decarboxylase-like PLP-dependent enzyme
MTRTQEYRQVLKATLDHAIRHIDQLDASPASASVGLDELRRRLDRRVRAVGSRQQETPRHVRGMELADSWTTDGHKWLNTPFDCGYAFVADSVAHSAALSYQASYLVDVAGARDPLHWNPEWSRRARAVPTYAALQQLGREGIEKLVDQCCDYAARLVNEIGALHSAELVAPARINQGLVRFRDLRPGATLEDHDRRTDQIIARIVHHGDAYFGDTTWRGMRCMRISVCSWQTNPESVERAVGAVSRALELEATR